VGIFSSIAGGGRAAWATMGPASRLNSPRPLLRMGAAGAAIGGAAGGVYGAASDRGSFFGGMAKGAMLGAGLGMGGGAAVQLARNPALRGSGAMGWMRGAGRQAMGWGKQFGSGMTQGYNTFRAMRGL